MQTPCDYPDDNGNYICPYADTYTGFESEMCRVCCGLGVDESEVEYDDYSGL